VLRTLFEFIAQRDSGGTKARLHHRFKPQFNTWNAEGCDG